MQVGDTPLWEGPAWAWAAAPVPLAALEEPAEMAAAPVAAAAVAASGAASAAGVGGVAARAESQGVPPLVATRVCEQVPGNDGAGCTSQQGQQH
jgi:hypothetical protein